MGLKAVSIVSTVISGVSTAIGALGATATITTKVMAGLNVVMSANVLGAVAAAIALVVGGLILLNSISSENKTRTEELIAQSEVNIEKLEAERQAYDELTEAKYKQAEADLAQLSYVEGLASELSSLADESGRVKDADEARVEFILGELNSALGTEYKLIGDVISNYDTLTSSVYKAIEAQKAEVILAAEKDVWAEAIKRQKALTEEQTNASLDYAEALGIQKTAQDNLNKIKEVASGKEALYARELENAIVTLSNAEGAVTSTQKAYDTATDNITQKYCRYSTI